MGPSLLQQLGSRFSLANGLSRLSTSLGLPDALQRLGLTDSAVPQQPHGSSNPAANDGAAPASQAAAKDGAAPSTQAAAKDGAAPSTQAAVNAAIQHCGVHQRPAGQLSQHSDQGASQQHINNISQQRSSPLVLGDKDSHVRHGRKHRSTPEVLQERHSNENQTDTSLVGEEQADSVTRQPLQEMQAVRVPLKGEPVAVFGLLLPLCSLQ